MKARPIVFVKNDPEIGGSRIVEVSPKDATHVEIHFPNLPYHDKRYIPVQIGGARKDTGNWSWNGDTEKPTLRPSILTQAPPFRCHSFVNDGKVQFLNDCSHENKGLTLDLLELDK